MAFRSKAVGLQGYLGKDKVGEQYLMESEQSPGR